MSKSTAFVKGLFGDPRKKKVAIQGPYLKKNEDFRFSVVSAIENFDLNGVRKITRKDFS